MARAKTWTNEEIERLRDMIEQRMDNAEIATELGRSRAAVQSYISRRLGGRSDLRPARSDLWNKEDLELAGLMLALGISHSQVGTAVNRSEGAIASQLDCGRISLADGVEKLDLKAGARRPCNEDEDTLIDLLSRRGWSASAIAPMLCRTPGAVETRKHRLGISTKRYPSRQRQKSMWRPCMCCGQKFRSEGIHNRLCIKCKESDLVD
jgi:hypothetical protein